MERFTGILGILVILLVCVLFSKPRRSIRPALIFWGVGLQLTFAFIVLKTPAARLFEALSDKVNARRHLPQREAVIQDVEIPVERGAEFLRHFAHNVRMRETCQRLCFLQRIWRVP